jgi:hypothetical protein
MSLMKRLNEWRDAQSSTAKGCGCATLFAIGLLACAFIMGAVMGDYVGPREGAAADIRSKNHTLLIGFIAIALCWVAGRWLISNRRP